METLMLCGPITGDFSKDRELFELYEEAIRQAGFIVINPIKVMNFLKESTKLEPPNGSSIKLENWVDFCCLSRCLNSLVLTQGIFLMPNWDINHVSSTIFCIAQILGLKTYTFSYNKEGSLIIVEFIYDEFDVEGDDNDDGEDDCFYSPQETKDDNDPSLLKTPGYKHTTSTSKKFDKVGIWFKKQMNKSN